MHAGLSFEKSIRVGAGYRKRNTFYPGFIPGSLINFLCLPAFALDVAAIHAKKHRSPVHGLGTPLTGVERQDRIVSVVGAGKIKSKLKLVHKLGKFFSIPVME